MYWLSFLAVIITAVQLGSVAATSGGGGGGGRDYRVKLTFEGDPDERPQKTIDVITSMYVKCLARRFEQSPPPGPTAEQWEKDEDFCFRVIDSARAYGQRVPLGIERIRKVPDSVEELARRDPFYDDAAQDSSRRPGDDNVNRFSAPNLNDAKNGFIQQFTPQRERSRDRGVVSPPPSRFMRRPMGLRRGF